MRYKHGLDSQYKGMMHEDHSAPANLPQDKKLEYYPPRDYVDNYHLDDTILGIDDNSRNSVGKVKSHQSDSMY